MGKLQTIRVTGPDGIKRRVPDEVVIRPVGGKTQVRSWGTVLLEDTHRVVADFLEREGFEYTPGKFGVWKRKGVSRETL